MDTQVETANVWKFSSCAKEVEDSHRGRSTHICGYHKGTVLQLEKQTVSKTSLQETKQSQGIDQTKWHWQVHCAP